MKSLKCDLCDYVAEGETFDDWVQALAPHYLEAHADVANDPKNLTLDERLKWADRNRARFDEAASSG